MTITEAREEDWLVLKTAGRLDTATAPELENRLEAVNEKTVLDFSELEYISSAGLRVLLKTQKRLGAEGFKLRSVGEVVQEVLDITGFTDILTIE